LQGPTLISGSSFARITQTHSQNPQFALQLGHASVAFEREAEEKDMIEMTYGSKIVLRVQSTKEYARVKDHSSNKKTRRHASETQVFTILNADTLTDRGPIQFQERVCLCTPHGHFISCNDNGTIHLARPKAGNRKAKWTIMSAQRASIDEYDPNDVADELGDFDIKESLTGPVKVFDTIALRSHNDNYLGITVNGNLRATSSLIGPDESWWLSKASLPHFPDWYRTRYVRLRRSMAEIHDERDDPHYALRLAESRSKAAMPDVTVLNSYPVEVQEQMFVEELLFVLLGVEGKWIEIVRNDNGEVNFQLPTNLRDASIVYIISRILPLCEHYYHVDNFVEIHSRYEYGYVNHAFCAAVREMLKEYLILVAQLEHQYLKGALTLQRLWFYVQPSLQTMERLHHITSMIAESKAIGGALLNVIERQMMQEGDPAVRSLYVHLMMQASVPYFEMLEQWIYHGVIKDDDPYDEFQIQSHGHLKKENLREDFNDNYWDDRYTVRTETLPFFLEKLSDKILTTGKYLNVIRECGRTIDSPVEEKITYTTAQREYADIVERASAFASRKLLDLLMNDEQIMARLRSIKRYFLIDQGDFFVHFMDNAEEELQKPVSDIATSKLESLLELALRTSMAVADPFKDDLHCYLEKSILLFQLQEMKDVVKSAGRGSSHARRSHEHKHESVLKGMEAFVLAYKVRWPSSLIISKRTLTQYQLIFRHLFSCKHVERQLCQTWLIHQSTKELDLRSAFASSYCLRQRMLHFWQNLMYYMMVEVLEPNWHSFEEAMKSVTTVDEVLQHQNAFLEKCLHECLLTNEELLRTLHRISSNCLLFADSINKFLSRARVSGSTTDSAGRARNGNSSTNYDLRKSKIQTESHHLRAYAGQEKHRQLVHEAERSFDENLRKFMEHLRNKSHNIEHHHLANLGIRLDFNNFYSVQYNLGDRHNVSVRSSASNVPAASSRPPARRPPVVSGSRRGPSKLKRTDTQQRL
jgi:gamma-tubulin complex component 2